MDQIFQLYGMPNSIVNHNPTFTIKFMEDLLNKVSYAMNIILTTHTNILQTLKESLAIAQSMMKQRANQHKSEQFFVVDMIFLQLQHYK